MKKLFLLLFAAAPLLSSGQDAGTTAEKPGKQYFIGFNVSPDYNYRTLSSGDLEDFFEGKAGVTTGLNAGFQLNERTSLETGLQYSLKGFQTKPMGPIRYITEGPYQGATIQEKYNFHFIDIPVRVNAVFGRNKTRFIFGTGLVANIFIKEIQHISISWEDGRKEETSGETDIPYNRVIMSAFISAGVQYQLNPGLNLRIEPTARHQVISLPKSGSGYLWNAGLNLGLYYNL